MKVINSVKAAKERLFSVDVAYAFPYQIQQSIFETLWALIENKLPTDMYTTHSDELVAAQNMVPKGIRFTVTFKVNKDATFRILKVSGHDIDASF
ncbi:MAG: hypothetical protein NTW48_09075 [Chloroflexi bacterium]|nr:hypothetical protein [Chloroflexota bacterium]